MYSNIKFQQYKTHNFLNTKYLQINSTYPLLVLLLVSSPLYLR